MKRAHPPAVATALLLAAVLLLIPADGVADNGHTAEHGPDGDDRPGSEGEESRMELGLDATYDEVRRGVRLILAYDGAGKAFKGTVENITTKTLRKVRVEVHLSLSGELGPTRPADLAPGEKRQIHLPATPSYLDRWSAHPEVGSDEHGRASGSTQTRAD